MEKDPISADLYFVDTHSKTAGKDKFAIAMKECITKPATTE